MRIKRARGERERKRGTERAKEEKKKGEKEKDKEKPRGEFVSQPQSRLLASLSLALG